VESPSVECGERGSNPGCDGAGSDGADGASARARIARQRWSARKGERSARIICCYDATDGDTADGDTTDGEFCAWIVNERSGLFYEGDEAEFGGGTNEAESCSISYSAEKIACHR